MSIVTYVSHDKIQTTQATQSASLSNLGITHLHLQVDQQSIPATAIADSSPCLTVTVAQQSQDAPNLVSHWKPFIDLLVGVGSILLALASLLMFIPNALAVIAKFIFDWRTDRRIDRESILRCQQMQIEIEKERKELEASDCKRIFTRAIVVRAQLPNATESRSD